MEIIGVEFEGFACFEKRFVPLRPVLNILVGKNNTGKTALLRGLSALDGLPFQGRIAISRELAGYCHNREPAPNFFLRVLFRLEPAGGDPQLIRGTEEQWRDFIQNKNHELSFAFRVWPEQSIAVLEGCHLSRGDSRLRILERSANGQIVHYIPSFEGGPEDSRPWEMKEVLTAPDGKSWQVFNRDGPLRGFAGIGPTRLIDAHRSVRTNLSPQTVTMLPPNGETLAPFLQTLQGSQRETFQQIEDFVLRVFPEFRYVNPESIENTISLSLTLRTTGEKVRLVHCGTGVEQSLVLATFVITSQPGAIILLDEPHSYLHPPAERELIKLLEAHNEHTYFISTHSAVLINSVPADRIIYVARGEPGSSTFGATTHQLSNILRSLGYNNSDLLFNDRLVLVEGPSDQAILPLLLERSGAFDPSEINRTGFPTLDGEGRARGRTIQTSILYYERFLQNLGRSNLPRVYLFDGGCSGDDQILLKDTTSPATGETITVRFLPRYEIENYLLVPSAIAAAVAEQAGLDDVPVADISEQTIRNQIDDLLAKEDGDLFPRGKSDPFGDVKASVVLERIFVAHHLSYRKRVSGVLIARHISQGNQPALQEIVALLKHIFRPAAALVQSTGA